MPPDPQLLPWLTGPYAALVLCFGVIWGLWRLYQQERAERRETGLRVEKLTDAIEDLMDTVAPEGRRRR